MFGVQWRRLVAVTFVLDAIILGVIASVTVILLTAYAEELVTRYSWVELATGSALAGVVSCAATLQLRARRRCLLLELGVISLAIILGVMGVEFLLRGTLPTRILVSGPVVALAAVFAALVCVGWRFMAIRMRVPGFVPVSVAVLGTGERGHEVVRVLETLPPGAIRLVAVIDPDHGRAPMWMPRGCRFLSHLQDLRYMSDVVVDQVVVALENRRGRLPLDQLLDLRCGGVAFHDDIGVLEQVKGQLDVSRLRPAELLFGSGFCCSKLRWVSKRAVDVLVSTLMLVGTAPIMLVTAALIVLETKGSPLYRQVRVGRGGKNFTILKFRSMVDNAERSGKAVWAKEGDSRVTRVGAVIRKLRIDELPQLINVLRGDMSFVGPRPERPEFVKELEKEIPFYRLRTAIRPGITGWAQVRYRYGASRDDACEKLKYDLFYMKHAGPLLDTRVVFRTVGVVLTGFGAR